MLYRDPFNGHRLAEEVFHLTVRRYCRCPLSCRGVRAFSAARGITVDAATVYQWVQKFGSGIPKRAFGRHRNRRELTWHHDETYVRVHGLWCYLRRAMDQHVQLINLRLAARRTASAAEAFPRQTRKTIWLYQPLIIITGKTRNYSRVIGEWNARLGLEYASRKHENERTEDDHAVLKQLLSLAWVLRRLSSAKAILKKIETFRAVQHTRSGACELGVMKASRCLGGLLEEKEPLHERRPTDG